MRIVVVGKAGSIVGWIEDTVDAFRAAGHEVKVVASRNPRLSRRLERVALSSRIGAPLAVWIARSIRKFQPDLILCLHADQVPHAIVEEISAIPGRGPLIAWVGDRFNANFAMSADLYDVVAYTDSGLLDLHRDRKIRARSAFVPHGANPSVAIAGTPHIERSPMLTIVAGPTEHRCQLLAGVPDPISVYGPEWDRMLDAPQHRVDCRRIDRTEVSAIYARHLAVLNVKHERHVINGLNQRSFAPYIQGTPVVSDDLPDLRHCFDPGRETLVYNSPAELTDIYRMLRQHPKVAAEIGQRGRARVLGEHTYEHRLQTFRALA